MSVKLKRRLLCGRLGVIEENNKPTIPGARLKVVEGMIYEIEAIGCVAKHGIKYGWK